MLPTILVAIVLVVADMGGWLWVIAPIGLANGVAAMVISSWLGGKLLDARAIRVVQTLQFVRVAALSRFGRRPCGE